MPHDRTSLILDAAVAAYVDVISLLYDPTNETVGQSAKIAARFVAIAMLEAALDFEDRPAFQQFDERLAQLTPEAADA